MSRNFWGVITQWFDPVTLERRVATLACHRHRMMGTVTSEGVVNEFIEVFDEYGIERNVVMIITDKLKRSSKHLLMLSKVLQADCIEPQLLNRCSLLKVLMHGM